MQIERIEITETKQLNNLVSSGIIEAYPPLCDTKGSYTAQFEHVSIYKEPCRDVPTNINSDYIAAPHSQRGYQSRG